MRNAILLSILSLVFLVGCSKEDLPDPPPPVVVPKFVDVSTAISGTGTGKIDPITANVKIGSDLTFHVDANPWNKISKIISKGVTLNIPANCLSHTFTEANIQSDPKIQVTLTNDFYDYVKDVRWYMTQAYNFVNNKWEPAPSDDIAYTMYIIFASSDGKTTTYRENGTILGGPYTWNINGNTLNEGSHVWTIESASADKLVLTDSITQNGVTYRFKYDYGHAIKPVSERTKP